MKKLIVIFTILLMSTIWLYGQKPTNPEFKVEQSPYNKIWGWNRLDSTQHTYSSWVGDWVKFFTAKTVQHKIDSLSFHTSINLGSKLDTAKATVDMRYHWNLGYTAYGWGNWASNFGTTTGTILEGRTFGTAANSASTDFAPASGSANYLALKHFRNESIDLNLVFNKFGTTDRGDYPTQLNTPTTYGAYISVADGGNQGFQLFGSNFSAIAGTDMYFRTKATPSIDFNTDWTSWKKVWDSANLSNPITGTGTSGYIPKFTGIGSLGDSPIFSDDTNVGIDYSTGTEITNHKLAVNGKGYFADTLKAYSFKKIGGTSDQYLLADGSTISETEPIYIGDSASIKTHIRTDLDLDPTNELDSIYVTNNSRWYKGGDSLTISTGSSRSETPHSNTANTSYTHDVSTYINTKVSTNTNINITLSNLGDGQTGNIEVTYTGAAVVTFIVDSSYTLDVSPNILNATTNAYTVSILSKSSGHYITSYYRSGNVVYINGR